MGLLNDYTSKSYHKTKYSRNCNVSVNVNVEPTPVNINCNNSSNSSNAEDKINKILIRFYARLYTECIIPINEFLSFVKENDTNKLIEIFTAERFADLVAKIYAIKVDITKEFEDYTVFPEDVTLFINNYINTLYLIVDIFGNIIRIIQDNSNLSEIRKVLQSLESISEYIDKYFSNKNMTNIETTATSTVSIKLTEPYNTYYTRYGLDSGPIDSEKLAEIQYELDQSAISNT